MCPKAPGEVVVDKETRGAPSLDPGVVKSPDPRERGIRTAALQNDRECGECFLEITRTEQAFIPGKCRIEIVHKILRKDVGIPCGKRVRRLRGKSVEQRTDGVCVGSLHAGIGLKAKPGRVFLIDVVIDSNRLYLFMIIARMRSALAIRATVSIIGNGGLTSAHIERTAKYC